MTDDARPHAHRHHGKLTCIPTSLSRDLLIPAARTAIAINGRNRPHPLAAAALGLNGSPIASASVAMRIAVVTQKYWHGGGVKLAVFFMDNPPYALRDKIIGHMNAWAKSCNIAFAETADPSQAQVRIARGGGDTGGYWSYIGTDILHIPQDQPTMNLEGFTMRTEDSEFFRVVRHETGHTLGCPHEHMRGDLIQLIDEPKAIAYFRATQGWSEQMTRDQVLTPLDQASIMGTPQADAVSIMCYQIPGAITRSGEPILGGTDIDETDYAFMATIYPKPAQAAAQAGRQDMAALAAAPLPASPAPGPAGGGTHASVTVTLTTGVTIDFPAAAAPDILDRIFGPDQADPHGSADDGTSASGGAAAGPQDTEGGLDHGPQPLVAAAALAAPAPAKAGPAPVGAPAKVGPAPTGAPPPPRPYAPKRYTNVQLIAYEVPTLQTSAQQSSVAAIARLPVPPPAALDDHDDIDAFARLRRFAGVVDQAARQVAASGHDSAQTLKIFMAPEFYFRPANGQNAYSFNRMTNILDSLRNMFVHPDFSDWLFVPGSIFSSQPANAVADQPDGRRAYFNTACIIKGGDSAAPFTFVHKRLVSTIDGAPPAEAALHNPLFTPLLMSWAERRSNVFRCDNVTFGIEVCLDHSASDNCRVLKTVLSDWQANEHQPAPAIDVHLLTSCGMAFNARSAAARVGGYLFGVDGHPVPRDYGGHSQVDRVTAQNLAGNAAFTPQDVNGHAIAPPVPGPLPGGLACPVAPDEFGSQNYAQRILYYPPQSL